MNFPIRDKAPDTTGKATGSAPHNQVTMAPQTNIHAQGATGSAPARQTGPLQTESAVRPRGPRLVRSSVLSGVYAELLLAFGKMQEDFQDIHKQAEPTPETDVFDALLHNQHWESNRKAFGAQYLNPLDPSVPVDFYSKQWVMSEEAAIRQEQILLDALIFKDGHDRNKWRLTSTHGICDIAKIYRSDFPNMYVHQLQQYSEDIELQLYKPVRYCYLGFRYKIQTQSLEPFLSELKGRLHGRQFILQQREMQEEKGHTVMEEGREIVRTSVEEYKPGGELYGFRYEASWLYFYVLFRVYYRIQLSASGKEQKIYKHSKRDNNTNLWSIHNGRPRSDWFGR